MRIRAGMEKEYAEFREMNTQDFYSKGVIDYAERWCKMMEEAMESGSSVAQAAEATHHTADTELISGSMFGFAVGTLKKFWEHGDELLDWHENGNIISDIQSDEEPQETEPTMQM